MKKLLPVAALALLATACSYDNNGHMHMGWNGMSADNGNCSCCMRPREALSDRSLGSVRGKDNMPIEYNEADVYGMRDGSMQRCDMMMRSDVNGQPVYMDQGRATNDGMHHHHRMMKRRAR
jgi:hypothetical protein